VLVATVRALKHHGGGKKDALRKGIPNLRRHIENIIGQYGLPCVVAVNRFPGDTEAELEYVCEAARALGAEATVSDVFAKGGEGGEALAELVLSATQKPNRFRFVYDLDQPLTDKIKAVARNIYRADDVSFSPESSKQLKELEKAGFGNLPVCIAKTQYSFTDNAKKLAAPEGFTVSIRQVRLSAGAGFVAVIAGDIMTMPGLPKIPAAEMIDVDEDGNITGLF
jgi:formate--tetrahydrofolate ligase